MRNGAVRDFTVTFFIGNHIVPARLSEVVRNRSDGTHAGVPGLPKHFVLPFFQENTEGSVEYLIRQNGTEKYGAFLNSEFCGEHVIQSGDYVKFRDSSEKTVFRVLFVLQADTEIGYGKYRIENNMNIFIGRTPDNDISFDFTNYISREKHAVLRIDGNGAAYIEDLKRSVGIYVNGRRTHSRRLDVFDEVFMMGLSIVYMGSYIAVNRLHTECALRPLDSFYAKDPLENTTEEEYFVSTPRIVRSLDDDVVEVDAPPAPPTMDDTPAFLVLGPSLTMSAVMLASLGISISNAFSGGNVVTLIASGIMAVGMLAGALLWPSLLRKYQRRTIAEKEEHREKRYTQYLSRIRNEIDQKKQRSVEILNDSLRPSPEALCRLLDDPGRRLHLWERSSTDADFLDVRVGTGRRPFDVSIKTPKKGFQLYDDAMREMMEKLPGEYQMLDDVPLVLNLARSRTVGMIGKPEDINTVLSEMILDIIALHSYDEVKVVFAVPPERMPEFEMYKNVPHVWSNDRRIRYFAVSRDEVHFVFSAIGEELSLRESEGAERHPVMFPYYVVIATDPSLIEREPLSRYLYDSGNTVGITGIFAYGDIAKLPKSCQTIVQCYEGQTGYYTKNENRNRFIPFQPDPVDSRLLTSFVKHLSRLKVKRSQSSHSLADQISFLQMYRVGKVSDLNIEQHWDSNNSAKTLAAPVGVMAGGEVFSLDIHEKYHGSHGLVAGMTGSGKSEFLQAFVLSLAINFSPKEVAFVLVDFKGGDMARPFMAKKNAPALPHLAATISNLSDNILYRALVSLEAEIRYRQRLFNESAATLGVDKLDINSYQKYFKGGRLAVPLPHLVIIIDEFAQLKTQQPEFLTQLVNIAQVGRSLGIHLILATQKPSGVVDPQILSNSRFRVCLKVADKQDSKDMIGRPDAAMIKNPGRLYIQVGYDEVFECVQSGFSGADYVPARTFMPDEEITVDLTDNTAAPVHSAKSDLSLSGRTDQTQLEAAVAEITALGQRRGESTRPLWMDMLPETVPLDSLERGKKGLASATVALVDYVREQAQRPLTIDFTVAGHIALYGASGTGKTTFLQTLVYSMVHDYEYTPDELNICAMDFGGRNLGYLNRLPHTAGVVFSGEDEKIVRLVSGLKNIIAERKQLFAANGCSTFTDFRSVSAEPLPAVLVLIDNYASFRDKYMDIADSLTEVIGEGKTFGVYFVITGSTRNAIYYRVKDHIATYFALKMNDKDSYLDILNTRPPVFPENVNGRGITVIGKEVVEFQVALAGEGTNEAERLERISSCYSGMAADWAGALPHWPDGSRPADTGHQEEEKAAEPLYVPSRQMITPPEPVMEGSDTLVFGTSVSGGQTYGISLSEYNRVCVCGNGTDSIENCFRGLLKNITAYSGRRVLLFDGPESRFRELAAEFPPCLYIDNTETFDIVMKDMYPDLNARWRKEEACAQPLFLLISEFNAFYNMITDEQADFLRTVLKETGSPEHGICFICGYDVNGPKSNDVIFMQMAVRADAYLICENAYEKAAARIESLPAVSGARPENNYVCIGGRSAEIRW